MGLTMIPMDFNSLFAIEPKGIRPITRMNAVQSFFFFTIAKYVEMCGCDEEKKFMEKYFEVVLQFPMLKM